MNFEQWKFDLQTENNHAQLTDDPSYLGSWTRHDNVSRGVFHGRPCPFFVLA